MWQRRCVFACPVTLSAHATGHLIVNYAHEPLCSLTLCQEKKFAEELALGFILLSVQDRALDPMSKNGLSSIIYLLPRMGI